MKWIALVAALVALCSSAWAETQAEMLIVPPYPAATPWKNITDKSDSHMLMREWIPANQSVDDIADILTEQDFYDANRQTPAEFIKGLFIRIRNMCADLRVNGPVEHTENGYPIAYAQIYCAKQKDTTKDVDIFLKAIAGKKAFYVVQYEMRRPADPGGVAGVIQFGKDELEKAQAHLARQKAANEYLSSQVQLCPPADGGACPASASTYQTGQAQTPPAGQPGIANDNDPGPDDVSKNFEWTPGKTTSGDVESKFGEASVKKPGPNGHYTYLYQFKNGIIVVCLFNKSGTLIRTLAYRHD